MILGFNHNIMYRGEVFHVQTEDSGVENPTIVTLLYKGGVILGSAKTSYADILNMESLEEVVEELMKEQHKAVMRRLKSGEFDERIAPGNKSSEAGDAPPTECSEEGSGIPLSQPVQEPAASLSGTSGRPDALEADSGEQEIPKGSGSLDEAILSFFGIHE